MVFITIVFAHKGNIEPKASLDKDKALVSFFQLLYAIPQIFSICAFFPFYFVYG
jgi:hypothetical protein